ncbi:hypothetical protein Kisp01_69500 [Kineosporia sp. NBRC 101677]|nr:hypothetical protein Kisp01_69500 [Kineosporia sp. NBRC 101677]
MQHVGRLTLRRHHLRPANNMPIFRRCRFAVDGAGHGGASAGGWFEERVVPLGQVVEDGPEVVSAAPVDGEVALRPLFAARGAQSLVFDTHVDASAWWVTFAVASDGASRLIEFWTGSPDHHVRPR